tara:strand:+ start:1611 stop:1793 length:183 start_codon:yes stop_codon:yes gene_type:complete
MLNKENYYLVILYLGFFYIYINTPKTKLIINYPDYENVENLTLVEDDIKYKVLKQNKVKH